MNILITGGAGYIGSVICELLNNESNNIVVIDDLRDGNQEAIPKNAKLIIEDFGNKKNLREVFSKHKIDIVLHLAASANVPDSVINPQDYYFNNVTNTLALLQVMLEFKITKIIFSSSAAVYGEPQYIPIDESHPLMPVNPYGYSKLIIENVLKDYSIAYGLNYVIFRYFCAAGATNDHGESRKFESHLIPLVVDNILNVKDEITVFGNKFKTTDGTGERDYIHVEDIAKAHILAIHNIDQVNKEIFNLGNGKGYSVFEVIKSATNLFSRNVHYNIGPKRTGDPAVLVATYDKAFKMLGWKPEFNLEEIIKSTYIWRKSPKY